MSAAPTPSAPRALVLTDVHKSFGAIEVLKGVSLEVAPHEVVCLIGASGSGKSTMLRCINLLESVDSGTIVVDGQTYALHLLPAGILTPGVVPVIGNGVVIDLGVLFDEIDQLGARGVDTSRLVVSANAHVIPSYNRTIDKVTERFLGSRRIGTTGRGIGPTYADKMNRVGILL
jgi:ABC-type histidine transport system ATPase subunit